MSEEPIIARGVLDRADVASTTWRKLQAHLELRLARLRQDNDEPLDPERTAAIRGEIKAIKNLLTLGNLPAPANAADEDTA